MPCKIPIGKQIWREHGEKNAFFAQQWQSSIPPQDKPRFEGLQYYPPDPSYKFELELHEHREKQAVTMAYTKGNEQALQAYKRNPQEEALFVPFKDATFGKET